MKYKVSESDRGFVNVNIADAESGEIKVKYTGTPIQHIADIISILTLAGILLYLFKPSVYEAILNKKH